MSDLRDRARAAGLTLDYDGTPVPDATLELILGRIATEPPVCFLPATLREAPGWGVFCQLYELRSADDWGVGDFAALARLARTIGEAGGEFLGINPVHALFTANPWHCSPFSPSNRRFLNPLYISVPGVEGWDGEVPERVGELRGTDLVDWPGVAAVKLKALRRIFKRNQRKHPTPAFRQFRLEGGAALENHALFEALSHRFADTHGAGFPGWPEGYHDPRSEAVRRFAEENEREIAFHAWLQFVARCQLGEAAEAAKLSGMRVGLYLDLAVGEAPDGSAAWGGGDAVAMPGLEVAAPPDMFAAEGQAWGLAAPSPVAMERTGFADFRAMIRAQMRHAGALRIDHAMALRQLFLIPAGQHPSTGTHVRYPMEGLVAALAAESRAHRAVVIGEDLGFVPDGFRPAMAEANILSYRILLFEQTETGFKPPEVYPEMALACLSTHDLPVLAEWWRGGDVALRREHGLVGPEDSEAHAGHRAREREWLVRLAEANGGLAEGMDVDADELPPALMDAAHRLVAATPSVLCAVRLADLVGPRMPTNVPGVVGGHPNWRPRAPLRVEEVGTHETFTRTAALMRAARPRP